MNTKEKKSFFIHKGPNRDMLFDACKYARNEEVVIPLQFSIGIGYTQPVSDPGCAYVPMAVKDFRIFGIQHEGRSDIDKLKLCGICEADLLNCMELHPVYAQYWFEATYDTKCREGVIQFTDLEDVDFP